MKISSRWWICWKPKITSSYWATIYPPEESPHPSYLQVARLETFVREESKLPNPSAVDVYAATFKKQDEQF